jgi:hypothetical protein
VNTVTLKLFSESVQHGPASRWLLIATAAEVLRRKLRIGEHVSAVEAPPLVLHKGRFTSHS